MPEVATKTVPLVQDADGVMRVRGTRITLDTNGENYSCKIHTQTLIFAITPAEPRSSA